MPSTPAFFARLRQSLEMRLGGEKAGAPASQAPARDRWLEAQARLDAMDEKARGPWRSALPFGAVCLGGFFVASGAFLLGGALWWRSEATVPDSVALACAAFCALGFAGSFAWGVRQARAMRRERWRHALSGNYGTSFYDDFMIGDGPTEFSRQREAAQIDIERAREAMEIEAAALDGRQSAISAVSARAGSPRGDAQSAPAIAAKKTARRL